MRRALKIIVGIIGVAVGMGFVMPAVAQWRHEGAMTALSVVLLLLGLALTLGGGGVAIHGFAKRSA